MMGVIGAVMSGAACGYFGIRMRLNLKTRCQSLSDIYESLEALEGEIRFGMNRLKRAFEIADRNGLFLEAAANIECDGARRAWSDAVMSMQDRLRLADADVSALLSLGSSIGKTDSEGQITSIRYVKSLIASQLEAAKEDYGRRAKLYSSGGFLIGALVVLALW